MTFYLLALTALLACSDKSETDDTGVPDADDTGVPDDTGAEDTSAEDTGSADDTGGADDTGADTDSGVDTDEPTSLDTEDTGDTGLGDTDSGLEDTGGPFPDDLDGDGYGDVAYGGDDCDDTDDSVYPGASEICGDGVVNDCDGAEEDAFKACGELALTAPYVEYQGVAFDDQVGHSLSSAGDINGDGVADLIIGAPHVNISTGAGDPGRAYVVYGGETGTVSLSGAYAELVGELDYDSAGSAVTGVGDQNGDGYDDVLVGAEAYTAGSASGAGIAYLVYGGVSGTVNLASADARLLGGDTNGAAGCAADGGRDVDGDGAPDFAVGAYAGEAGYGGIYVYTTAPTGNSRLPDSADIVITGDTYYGFAGDALAMVSDVDGDGVDDFVIGAQVEGSGGPLAGAAYVVYGGAALTDMSLADADLTLTGEDAYNYAGISVSGAGDFDGDGLNDLIVGASGDNSLAVAAGAAYVVSGGTTGAVELSDASLKLTGEEDFAYARMAVSEAGDADGDGAADVVVGAPGQDTSAADTGAIYLVYGPLSGTVSLADTDRVDGVDNLDTLGTTVDSAGDVNGDGMDDLLMGARGRSVASVNAGSVFIGLTSGY